MRRAIHGLVAALALLTSAANARADAVATCAQASDEAQRARDEGRLLEARDRFRACTRQECPAIIRKDCGSWEADVVNRLPTVVFAARDEAGRDLTDVRVFLDGKILYEALPSTATPIDPGEHAFRFERPGTVPEELRATIREGERLRSLGVVLRRPATSTPRSTVSAPPDDRSLPLASFLLAGVGVVSAGAGGVLYAMARSDYDALPAGCATARTCSDEDVDPIRTKRDLAYVAFGVSAAALVAAVVVHLASPGRTTPRASWLGPVRF